MEVYAGKNNRAFKKEKKVMVTYIVIGAPGQGKSEFIKEMIRGRRAFVFDVQNEYGSRTKYKGQKPLNLSNNPNEPQSRYVPSATAITLKEDVIKFIQMAAMKKDTNVVLEECTVYLEGRQEEGIKKLIVNRLHTGNSYSFVFHSIAAVPPRIMQMCNYVVLHKTLDEDYIVMHKYSRLWPYFRELQEKPDGSRIIIKLM